MAKKINESNNNSIESKGIVFVLDNRGKATRLELVRESSDLINLSEEEKIATKDYLEDFFSDYPIENCSAHTLRDIQEVAEVIGCPELINKYLHT